MSKTQRTLVDFDADSGDVSAPDDDESDADERPDWTPAEKGSHSGADGLQCECGRPLTLWASPVAARRHVRHYGDSEAGTVPGCPGCVDWRDNDDYRVESIPHAIRYMETESSATGRDHREMLVEHATERWDDE